MLKRITIAVLLIVGLGLMEGCTSMGFHPTAIPRDNYGAGGQG